MQLNLFEFTLLFISVFHPYFPLIIAVDYVVSSEIGDTGGWFQGRYGLLCLHLFHIVEIDD